MIPPKGRKAVIAAFGNPAMANGQENPAWKKRCLVYMTLPYVMYYSWKPDVPVTKVRVHKLIVGPLRSALQAVWDYARAETKKKYGYGESTDFYDTMTAKLLHQQGLDITGGTYCFRPIRDADALSMHAFGIAIDIDPVYNAMGAKGRIPSWFVRCFTQNGFTWGGNFVRKDYMHFQYAKNC